MASATAPSWSLARLVHALFMRLAEDVFVIVSSQRQRRSTHHIIHNIKSGGCLRHQHALALVVYTHIYIQQACPCHAWDLHHGPGAVTSAPFAPGIGGSSYSLRLRPNGGYTRNPVTVMGAMRGCWLQLDSDDACPLAVDSVRGTDCMAAMVFGGYGLCRQWTENYVI
jgi:hypothetical protein